MKKPITAEEICRLYQMTPLEKEGGLVCQSYVSDETLPEGALPGRQGAHPLGSAILYLLRGRGYSRMHRLPSEEIFHFYLGDPVEMLQLYPDGTGALFRMGQNLLAGERVQLVVPRGTWQATRLAEGSEWALLGTTMAPGYREADYEDGDLGALRAAYPQFAELLRELAGAPEYE